MLPKIKIKDIVYDKDTDRLTVVLDGDAKTLAQAEKHLKDNLDGAYWSAGLSPSFTSRRFEITCNAVSDVEPTWSDPHYTTSVTLALDDVVNTLKHNFKIRLPMLEFKDLPAVSDDGTPKIRISPASNAVQGDILPCGWFIRQRKC